MVLAAGAKTSLSRSLPFKFPTSFNIKDFGAKGDGLTKNTKSIEKAIAACSEAGGGMVLVPSGTFLTGPIHLKSNINLHLDAGATLLFSTDFEDYPTVPTRWEGIDAQGYSPLIWGKDLSNISVTGKGVIDGQGSAWWKRHAGLVKVGEGVTPQSAREKEFARLNKDIDAGDMVGTHTIYWRSQFLRPCLIEFNNCKNILIDGVTLLNSPFWTVHPIYSEKIIIRGITIKNPKNSPNTDGINPDSSRDIYISDCDITVGDDCITLKSGRDRDGRKVGRPCENITITNCIMHAGHGGLVIGSEMSGGVKNVVMSNCVFDGIDRGIRLKTLRGRGGVIENINVQNISMQNVHTPVTISMSYYNVPAEPLSERTPMIRNIRISELNVQNAALAGEFAGLEEQYMENITLSNSTISAKKGFNCVQVKGMAFQNLDVKIDEGPVLTCSQVKQLEVAGLKNREPKKDTPVIRLNQVEGAYIYNCHAYSGTNVFLENGKGNSQIKLTNNYLENADKKVSNVSGANKSAVKISD